MTRVLVLYHSTYGHIEQMAEAVAEGARSIEGVEVDIRRVPETVPEALAIQSGYKMDQAAPLANVNELETYDAIIVGAGTRFGTAAAQMRNFWDQTGGVWFQGKLIGKVGGAFTSSASQHGGNETTLIGMIQTLMHHGMVVAGLPYDFQGQLTLEEISGGSPYGATTITGGDGSRQPSANELAGARHQGAYIARLAGKLKA
ncbi:MAG: NAD(P)H:quinone oxidoreductase [Brevundimonas sp.]|uniref:NAD(P)H:quinone oxidoreductase n=1 Tax=Brevundimonas sp. TaxID=1871086 RepID=UPI00273699C3|nr:NAD(P)H:quinone oxidoreductase [Brevundimonas sp.]MBX9614702.1 NAD(P)H:quinone oxidoreductase [Caulobacteraceae bacterium]MDP3405713.1 NAD(P)H:quinone oxidoreductase [Brevundimonas sp.]